MRAAPARVASTRFAAWRFAPRGSVRARAKVGVFWPALFTEANVSLLARGARVCDAWVAGRRP